MHLLVIEDERVLCETIVRSLRRLAYSVDHCYDGDKALELLGTERYDLVLLDLNLPGKDGMTVLRTFRQRDRKTPGGPHPQPDSAAVHPAGCAADLQGSELRYPFPHRHR